MDCNIKFSTVACALDAMNLSFLTQLIEATHGSRLLKSFLYWNWCACRALHYSRSLRHWFIKRRQPKNRKQLTLKCSFLNSGAISIWYTFISSPSLTRLYRSIHYWIALWRDAKETQRYKYFDWPSG